ncbi:MAG TPA: cobaltochelatase subunit CobN [Noviherbaspirillum sp.]
MYLNKCWALLLLLCALCPAQAAQRTLALLVGDVESRPMVLAVRAVQPELKAAGVTVRVMAANRLVAADKEALARADVAVVNVVSRQLLQSLATELEQLKRARKPVFAVNGAVDDNLRNAGIQDDRLVQDYYRAGGAENLANLLRHLLHIQFGADVTPQAVKPLPESGIYDLRSGHATAHFDEYRQRYARHRPGAPWIGVVFYRASLVSGQTLPLAAIAERMERAGYNVLPVFGYPYETALRHFLDDAGKPRVDLIVALGMKVGGTASTAFALEKIGVPAINAITLTQQTAEEWQASKLGLDIIERTWQMAGAEFAGLIQPTVVGSRERVTDTETGLAFIEERPIAQRIERLGARVDAWLALQKTPKAGKRVAVLYYNYPHGSETIGAAYLNVLPESMWQILQRMQRDGYAFSSLPGDKQALQADIQRWGNYPSKDARNYGKAVAKLAEAGEAQLVPLADYLRWYAQLPAALRAAVEKAWGKPQQAPTLWRNPKDEEQFVFPVRRYGNVLLAPQPSRAWEQHLEKLHNDVSLPPSHEYMAFYLWLQHGYQTHAVVHLGTHGTHEWLSGKEAGLDETDPTEALIGALPNIYPYVMDDVGEGLQAKRRGMATIIDHMTPPFDVAGLNPDLRELLALLNDYRIAEQKSPLLARNHLKTLNALAAKSGVLKDMGRKKLASEADLEALEEYLDTVAGKLTPFGLHTFGVAPDATLRQATARAIVSLDNAIPPDQQAARVQQMDGEIQASAALELDRLMQALSGRYIPSGPGADLLRNPAALPTGRNFFGLDPSRIPARATYEEGTRLAQQLVQDYRARHGVYPDKLTVNLWGVETSRHEGIMEAQILALLGIRPRWDERGRVIGVEAIPRQQLGRPRVDVTMVSSGLFRDLFPNLLKLLDDAARLALQQDDSDSPLAAHSRKTMAALTARGMPEEEAQALAATRIFGLPSGAYGTNIEKLIPLTNAWQDERQVADVFINRMSHPFGGGKWGEDLEAPGREGLRHEIFRQALSGTRVALHSRSSNLFATLDNDDFFQYLGGTAMAVRSVDGKTPEVIVTDLSNPRRARHASLDSYMGQELQSRYLNPRWADGMLREGYAGARFLNRVVDYLWAWQVTVPEVVDATKWQRMYDTYIADRHGLRVRERFAQAGNLRAYQAITDRMLTAIETGYWKAPDAVRERLLKENSSAIAEVGLACGAESCSRATLRMAPRIAAAGPDAVPGADNAQAKPANNPAGAPAATRAATPEPGKNVPQPVSGFEMQQLATLTPAQKTIGALSLLLLASLLVGIGYWRRGVR